ncbi:MAG: GNAT family N-acetyltransferase [Muriicola sp.]|nr:GNAT family N-acetyltransferase [Muriicola sp.]
MEILFKPCSDSDLDDLIWISRKTFKIAFAAQNNPEDFSHYINTALSKETLASELANPECKFYFVYLKNTLAGFFKLNDGIAQTDIFDKKALELERIYVLEDYQNLGIGKMIIDEAVKIAGDAGKTYLWLGVWEENIRAIKFYEDIGFVKFGKHPYYIGQDKQMDWLMKLELSTL